MGLVALLNYFLQEWEIWQKLLAVYRWFSF